MNPRDVVEGMGGPVFGVHHVLASATFHHSLAEKVAAATWIAAAANDEKALGRRE
jgi:hypothetical protein